MSTASAAALQFEVGEDVEFERRENGLGPRWNLHTDNGASGVWVQGKVIDVEPFSVVVRYGDWLTRWKTQGHPHFDKAQEARPGWLRKKTQGAPTPQPEQAHICDCDYDTIVRVSGCQCGGV